MLNWFSKRLNELQEVKRDERGFTLIELLVVVIIIGILAAIAIPTFLNQRQSANEAACRSDVRNGASAAQAYAAANSGSYAGMVATGSSAPAEGEGPDNRLIEGYGWNLSGPSDDASVSGPGDGTSPTAQGFSLSVSCSNAPNGTYTFDSADGSISSS